MNSEFIHEKISMLFCSEKFHGGGGVDIAIIATSSRSMSLRDLRSTLDLQSLHGPELDNNISKL